LFFGKKKGKKEEMKKLSSIAENGIREKNEESFFERKRMKNLFFKKDDYTKTLLGRKKMIALEAVVCVLENFEKRNKQL